MLNSNADSLLTKTQIGEKCLLQTLWLLFNIFSWCTLPLLQLVPEHAVGTLHDRTVNFLHCVLNSPLQSLLGLLNIFVGRLNFPPDKVVEGLEVWGVGRPELLCPRQIHAVPAPLLRSLLSIPLP